MTKISVGNIVLNYDNNKKAGWLTFPSLDVTGLKNLCQLEKSPNELNEVDAITAELAHQNGKLVLVAGVININTKLQATAWARIGKQSNEFSDQWAAIVPYDWQNQIWDNCMGNNPSIVYTRYFI